MTTGSCLTGSSKVRKFQTMLHAKAKEEPERRFHALADKVWRADFLHEAWVGVRHNGGSAGVDGERFPDIEARGVDRWLGELSKRLRQWLCRKHKVRSEKYVRFSNERLWDIYGLIRLAPKTKGLSWAKA